MVGLYERELVCLVSNDHQFTKRGGLREREEKSVYSSIRKGLFEL
jgi:hypothetical protein